MPEETPMLRVLASIRVTREQLEKHIVFQFDATSDVIITRGIHNVERN